MPLSGIIRPCLWSDGQAREAAELYTSLFPNSRIVREDRAASDFPGGHEGDLLTVDFELDGHPFIGPERRAGLPFNESVSFESRPGEAMSLTTRAMVLFLVATSLTVLLYNRNHSQIPNPELNSEIPNPKSELFQDEPQLQCEALCRGCDLEIGSWD